MPLLIDLTSSDSSESDFANALTMVKTSTLVNGAIYPDKAYLLKIPTEMRCNIYDFLLDIKGTLTIYSQYEIAKEVDTQTITLMHVNRLLRLEVQEHFYKNQNFQFRSTPAIDNFIARIGKYHASLIKTIEFTDWMCRRLTGEHIANIFQGLTNVEQLTIVDPPSGHMIISGPNGYETYDKADVILCSSEKLAAGKIFVRKPGPYDPNQDFKMLFVPKHGELPRKVCYPYYNESRNMEVPVNEKYATIYTEILLPDKLIFTNSNPGGIQTEENASTSPEQKDSINEAHGVCSSGEPQKKRRRTHH